MFLVKKKVQLLRALFKRVVKWELFVIYNHFYWLFASWFIICSWRSINREILAIAPGSIVKINLCFLSVSKKINSKFSLHLCFKEVLIVQVVWDWVKQHKTMDNYKNVVLSSALCWTPVSAHVRLVFYLKSLMPFFFICESKTSDFHTVKVKVCMLLMVQL